MAFQGKARTDVYGTPQETPESHSEAKGENKVARLFNFLIPFLLCSCSFQLATVRYVVDGDTIRLGSGEYVRYLCLDTPEIHHPRKPPEIEGYQARDMNRQLLDRTVILELHGRDRYGRILAVVYSRGRNVNQALADANPAWVQTKWSPKLCKEVLHENRLPVLPNRK